MSDLETILLVEDDEDMRASCRQALEGAGYQVQEAASAREAEPIILRETMDAVVTDLRMPAGGGLEVLRVARSVSPDLPVILITAYPTVESAVEAFKGGVVDYLLKPFTGEQLLAAVATALAKSRASARAEILRHIPPPDAEMPEMLGASSRFRALLADIRRVAPLDGHVLVQGETGSGKELVARAIHRFSPRASGPLVVVNCAALPEQLIEAEMFGFEKGAFTGATRSKPGLLEEAHGGTLLLDEVGDLPAAAQAKLLRALEEKACRRVGALRAHPADVRIISATHRELRDEVHTGRFRADVFYRLSALEIGVPPLRDRPEDISLLAAAFLERLHQPGGRRRIVGFSEDALHLLIEHPWPGNVRELQNAVQKALARAEGPLITPRDLADSSALGCPDRTPLGDPLRTRQAKLAQFEGSYLAEAIRRHEGNVTRTAEALGIHRTTLQRLMKKYGIRPSPRC